MASGTISARYDISNVALSKTSAVTSFDGSNRCIRCGMMVTLSISAFCTIGQSWAKIFDFGSNVAPSADVFFPIIDAVSLNVVAVCNVAPDGIYIKGTATSNKVRGNCTWVIGK